LKDARKPIGATRLVIAFQHETENKREIASDVARGPREIIAAERILGNRISHSWRKVIAESVRRFTRALMAA